VAVTVKPNFSLAYSKATEMLAISNVITGFPFCTKDLVKEQLHTAVSSGSWCGGQRQQCGDSGSGLR